MNMETSTTGSSTMYTPSFTTTVTCQKEYQPVSPPTHVKIPIQLNPEPEQVIRALRVFEDDKGNLSLLFMGKEYPLARVETEAGARGKSRYDLALLNPNPIKEYSPEIRLVPIQATSEACF